jgi:crotonobetainyl-CoA:carnitine CoA-transferase CaiB-like acyl-CoA transferase
MTAATGPLAGIKVLEWAHLHMGPGGGMFLADMGADVIHVEQRGHGDGMRRVGTLWGVNYLLDHDRNAFTEDLLRSKRSLAIDLGKPEGRAVVHRLVAETDVFVTNMRPAGVLQQHMDYATLSAINPRLIYCHGTGFGDRGPDRDSPGNEMMGLARAGMMLGSAPAGSEPVYPTVGVNDRLGAIGVAMGILGALVARERTGIGQLVETSLLGWMINLQAVGAQIAANTGQDPRPTPRDDANDPLYNYYRCRDGTWVALGMLGYGNRFWPDLCEALGDPALATDPRFIDETQRENNHRALIKILDQLFDRVTYPEWEALARTYDFISTKVNALTDLAHDEQVLANDYITTLPHPDLGHWSYVTTPLNYGRTPVSIRSCAPQIGEHTTDILTEAGYTTAEIAKLRDLEVV